MRAENKKRPGTGNAEILCARGLPGRPAGAFRRARLRRRRRRASACARAAMAVPAGARPGRSASGRGCWTAITRTKCCASSCAKAHCPICSTPARPSRSTAISARWRESRKCCCKARPAKLIFCRAAGHMARRRGTWIARARRSHARHRLVKRGGQARASRGRAFRHGPTQIDDFRCAFRTDRCGKTRGHCGRRRRYGPVPGREGRRLYPCTNEIRY